MIKLLFIVILESTFTINILRIYTYLGNSMYGGMVVMVAHDFIAIKGGKCPKQLNAIRIGDM